LHSVCNLWLLEVLGHALQLTRALAHWAVQQGIWVVKCPSAVTTNPCMQVVQCLTEMGLSIRKARISSDGTWFVDEFVVDRVTDIKKLQTLR